MKKPITIKIPKCKKCKGKLEPRFTTDLDEKEKKSGKKARVKIVMGFCKKCQLMYILKIIQIEDMPQGLEALKVHFKKEKKNKNGKL